jgi:hypothetical protein
MKDALSQHVMAIGKEKGVALIFNRNFFNVDIDIRVYRG